MSPKAQLLSSELSLNIVTIRFNFLKGKKKRKKQLSVVHTINGCGIPQGCVEDQSKIYHKAVL
jgi:hypothetical protein